MSSLYAACVWFSSTDFVWHVILIGCPTRVGNHVKTPRHFGRLIQHHPTHLGDSPRHFLPAKNSSSTSNFRSSYIFFYFQRMNHFYSATMKRQFEASRMVPSWVLPSRRSLRTIVFPGTDGNGNGERIRCFLKYHVVFCSWPEAEAVWNIFKHVLVNLLFHALSRMILFWRLDHWSCPVL